MRMTPWESTPRKLAKSRFSATMRASAADKPSLSKEHLQNAKSFRCETRIWFITRSNQYSHPAKMQFPMSTLSTRRKDALANHPFALTKLSRIEVEEPAYLWPDE